MVESHRIEKPLLKWLQKKAPQPLTGAPAIRRQKTYSAESGYVYQYFYEGRRPASRDRDQGTEFVFRVTSDRKTSFPVSIFLAEKAVAGWEQERGRRLSSSERHAIAKMALFQAFDLRETPSRMREEVRVPAADVEAIPARLGVD